MEGGRKEGRGKEGRRKRAREGKGGWERLRDRYKVERNDRARD